MFNVREQEEEEEHLGEQHEDDVPAVGVQGLHHLLVQRHQLAWGGVGGEVGRQQGAEPAVLQDGAQHAAALRLGPPDKHLETGGQRSGSPPFSTLRVGGRHYAPGPGGLAGEVALREVSWEACCV